ncbi:SusC/RagA family TonB-linked outer membrane protein [Parachryseolinea silvisoli]|uniref:SusC/RagA family TonB-linked outer membrane protein n=1 Tax=Parachryseolinea silvisoli TaxID=2873601 RepID=UPI002265C1B7|nr:TonB-dependent receptor [Parachryseolinea silvisoli]
MRLKLLKILMFVSRKLIHVFVWHIVAMQCLLAAPSNGQDLEEVKITLNLKDAALTEVFSAIETQTDYVFGYNSQVRKIKKRFTFQSSKISIADILRAVSKQADLKFKQINYNITVSSKSPTAYVEPTSNTDVVITGQVTDAATGESMPGVNVIVKGTSIGTSTDVDGRYTLNVPDDGIVQFTFIGYSTVEVVAGTKTTIDVQLKTDSKSLEELVVIGYGTERKANLTGSVDQVNGEVFENRPVANVSQGLQGLIPNLNITPEDGKPIQSPTYNIRGITSIGQGGSALILIDGVEGDPRMLNPRDIANVSVLKDAASAAIYGARAAFGVVLITTKKPAVNKMTVDYSTNFSSKSPTTVPDLVTDGYQQAMIFNEAWTAWNDYSQTPQNVNKTLKFSPAYLEELKRRSEDPTLPKVEVGPSGEYVYYGNTDWYDLLYKDHTTAMEHNLSVSGSTEKASLYVTGRYFKQDGLFRYNSDDFKMYNFRVKGTVQVTPWLQLENNTQYSDMKYHNPLNTGEGGSIWRNIADEGHVMSPMFNPDGTLTYSAAYTVGDFWYGKNGIDMKNRVLRNTTGFTAEFFDKKFRVKGNFTYQNTDSARKFIRVPVPYSRRPGVIEYVGTGTNDIRIANSVAQYIATNIYAEYENTYHEKHYIKGLIGYNYEQSTLEGLSAQRNGLIYNGAQDINLALGQSYTTIGGWDKWNVLGGFFRLNYHFNDKYLVEVNGRYDGSSKFPTHERFAFFPSISAGWRVSNESFWHVSPNLISDLKLRASYGSLGNGSIASYAFQEKFAIRQANLALGGVKPPYTSQPNVLPDGLTWETSTTQNIGLDLSMVRNRLTLSADAYIRKTTDMFTVGRTLPKVFGTDVPKGNYADLKTTGWEIVLNWNDEVNVGSKTLGYVVRLTLADNQSVIEKYNNPDKKLIDYYEGQKVGEIWGYETEGFYESVEDIANHADQTLIKSSTSGKTLPGDIKFRDLDNNNKIDNGAATANKPGDMRVIGNSQARYTYGIMLGATWNNFSLSGFFQGVGKQDWWPGAEADAFWGPYNRPYNGTPEYIVGNYWTEDKPYGYFPRMRGYSAQSDWRELGVKQTKYLQNVAYLRLKNVQLSYTLPKSLVEKIRASNARVYVTGENLWTWSPLYRLTRDIDVESIGPSDKVLTTNNAGNGNNYPILKSYTAGLVVTF